MLVEAALYLVQSVSVKNLNGRYLFGLACTVAGAGLWGFSGSCAQYLTQVDGVHPIFLTAFRSCVAVVFFFLCIAVRKFNLERNGHTFVGPFHTIAKNKRLIKGFVLFALSLGTDQFAYSATVALTNAGTATILQMLSAVVVMVVTCLLARKFPKVRELAALILAMIATVLISTQGDITSVVLPFWGLFWGIVNAIAVAGYIMFPERFGLFEAIGSFASVACGTLFCAVVGSLAVFGCELCGIDIFTNVFALDSFGWLVATGGLGFTGTFLAFGLYVSGVKIVGPVLGSLLGAVEPVSAAIVSWAWLGTDFTLWDSSGLILMVAMLVLVTVRKEKVAA